MSHIVEMNFEIMDLDCLKTACKNLGFTFIENQKNYKWYGRWVGDTPMPEGLTTEDLGKCDHVISVPGCSYEVGVVKNKNGKGYSLQYDYYRRGGLEQVIGKYAAPIKQEYITEVTKKAIKNKNYMLVKNTKENGKVKLRVLVP
jgi:hypothetical protein